MQTIISYVTRTWLLAHCLYPLILFFVVLFDQGDMSAFLPIIMIIVGMILLASLPSLFVFWGVVYLIINSPGSAKAKLFFWCLIASILVAINAYLLAIGLSVGERNNDTQGFALFFGLPAVIAIFLSVLIRGKQFFSLQ